MRYCMGMALRGAIKNWSRQDWQDALSWITKDGSRFPSVSALKDAFLDELAQGHELVPYGFCDNWDWKEGCKGHEMPQQ